MATEIKSQQEFWQLFIDEIFSRTQKITDENEGSIADALAGMSSLAAREISRLVVDEVAKTFFATANGPEVTGGPDDLEFLAIDHYGESFARPGAKKATGVVTFSRPNDDAGDVIIPAGTIVKTETDASGNSIRFETVAEVTMTSTSINASVRAMIAGRSGNVLGGKITVIESSLTDSSITVTNALAFGDGADELTDAEYRQFIANKVSSIRGGIAEAIEAAALAVSGVEKAKAIETEKAVIEWDIGIGEPVLDAEYFRIPFSELYIADSNGTASESLINAVFQTIKQIRSFGVFFTVKGATPVTLNWSATIGLNVSGPNYEELSEDTSKITDAMKAYVNGLPIGYSFVIENAEAHIMSIFGPDGTNDLESFTTDIPAADGIAALTEKLVAGAMEVS